MKPANIRLGMGLLALPAILLQNNFAGTILQTAYVVVLAATHGRRFRVVPNLVLVVSVSIAHLLQPNGLHLFSIAGFPVTAGALILGAQKAFILMGLLHLSHYMVAARPQFPGKLGGLISLQFYYFERITTVWKNIEPKKPFIGAVDRLMETLEHGNGSERDGSVDNPPPADVRNAGNSVRKEMTYGSIHLAVLWTLYILGSSHILPHIP